jgi:hypothetical protein
VGHWERRDVAWWETNVIHCAFCGQMIPRDVWRSDEGLGFCNTECEGLYRTYWVPKYGAKTAGQG